MNRDFNFGLSEVGRLWGLVYVEPSVKAEEQNNQPENQENYGQFLIPTPI